MKVTREIQTGGFAHILNVEALLIEDEKKRKVEAAVLTCGVVVSVVGLALMVASAL